jgi:hypothetical protein
MRTVTIEVPDNDESEGAVRRVAGQLCSGFNIATIPIPPPLGLADALAVAAVVAEAQAKFSALAAVRIAQS